MNHSLSVGGMLRCHQKTLRVDTELTGALGHWQGCPTRVQGEESYRGYLTWYQCPDVRTTSYINISHSWCYNHVTDTLLSILHRHCHLFQKTMICSRDDQYSHFADKVTEAWNNSEYYSVTSHMQSSIYSPVTLPMARWTRYHVILFGMRVADTMFLLCQLSMTHLRPRR
jgi:hypothetical protein